MSCQVARQLSVRIEPENLHLPTPLPSLGEFEVPLRLPKSIPLPEGKVQWTLDVKIRRKWMKGFLLEVDTITHNASGMTIFGLTNWELFVVLNLSLSSVEPSNNIATWSYIVDQRWILVMWELCFLFFPLFLATCKVIKWDLSEFCWSLFSFFGVWVTELCECFILWTLGWWLIKESIIMHWIFKRSRHLFCGGCQGTC